MEDVAYRRIRARLEDRVDVIARRLAARLEAVWELHDLTWTELMAVQQDVEHRAEIPTPTDFWAAEALPRAATLREVADRTVDDEVANLDDAVARFHESVRLLARPRRDDELGRRARADALEILRRVTDSVPPGTVDELGARWQKRLRRTARRRELTTIVRTPRKEAELAVSKAEMQLLASTPWSHGDRLLSAVELAHQEIRRRLHDRARATVTRHRWPTDAASGRRAATSEA